VIRRLATAAAIAVGLALPAHALDLDNLSAAERATLHEEIRAYLLENPEVIMEAVSILEERQSEGQAQADATLVRENAEAIFDDGHSWVGGNPEGDVTLVEFMDYRCGYWQVAGDEAYKSVHDALMSYDGSMNETGFTRLADSLGLDANAIVAEMDSDRVSEVIAANHALARQLEISGTPSFVMGDQMLRGFVPQDAMQQVVDDIRAR
jgi:protein-disulfide isomerase